MTRTRILVVTGPTGSGKSERAVELAEQLNGEIVSADSVAVYRDFDIGSAKPSGELLERVPHHLVSIRDPMEEFSAGSFQKEADVIIQEIAARGRLPIIVGGTGLYIKALLHGLISGAGSSEERAFEHSSEAPFETLRRLDPRAAARIHPSDSARTKRALEYFLRTGESIEEAREQHRHGELRYAALVLLQGPSRDELYERINRRAEEMVRGGLIAEIAALLRKYPREARPFGSIGYRQGVQFVDSVIPSESALIQEIAQETRRFAKRQLTWWRNEPGKLGWIPVESPPERVLKPFLESSEDFKQDAVYLSNHLK